MCQVARTAHRSNFGGRMLASLRAPALVSKVDKFSDEGASRRRFERKVVNFIRGRRSVRRQTACGAAAATGMSVVAAFPRCVVGLSGGSSLDAFDAAMARDAAADKMRVSFELRA